MKFFHPILNGSFLDPGNGAPKICREIQVGEVFFSLGCFQNPYYHPSIFANCFFWSYGWVLVEVRKYILDLPPKLKARLARDFHHPGVVDPNNPKNGRNLRLFQHTELEHTPT